MAGWHHWLDGRECQWTLGVGDGQGGLASCSSWGPKESDTTEWLIWSDLRQHIKKHRHYFANKGLSNQGCGFSSRHVWMWELDCEESWVPKNWRFSTVVLEKTHESLLDYKEIQPVHPKGDQSWVFIGTPGLMLKLKLQYFGHLVKRADSLKKTLMLGKNEGRRRRGQQRMRWLDGLPTQWTWVWANSGR